MCSPPRWGQSPEYQPLIKLFIITRLDNSSLKEFLKPQITPLLLQLVFFLPCFYQIRWYLVIASMRTFSRLPATNTLQISSLVLLQSMALFTHSRICLKNDFIYLGVLGLCCMWAFSRCGEQDCSPVAVQGLLIAAASLDADALLSSRASGLQELPRVGSGVGAPGLESTGSVGLHCSEALKQPPALSKGQPYVTIRSALAPV